MDGASVSCRGEGQAHGLTTGREPLVQMIFRRQNRCTGMLSASCDQDHSTA